MSTLATPEAKARPMKSWLPSAVARERFLAAAGRGRWEAEWDRVLMLHWSVPVESLQKWVPFPLDLWQGRAWVSAVAFHLRGMKLNGVPWKLPFSNHAFLNMRAYVKVGDEPGIFFLREWVPWVPSIALARPLYGLPFVPGRLRYEHAHETGAVLGAVQASRARLDYAGEVGSHFDACVAGSLAEFLMERYTAFTEWRGWRRQFRVWHPPWRQVEVRAEVRESSLLELTGDWVETARFEGAHYSPGLPSVWMGFPEELMNA